jgi:O-acetyl-ADP-ribose deacetylase (regulator of RNase III)
VNNIVIKTGDITLEDVCAVVNAANASLLGGGGVDGAIHRAGGRAILRECQNIRKEQYPDGLPTGEAVATTAGNMKAKYVIHTVGPVYSRCGEKCESLLYTCYINAMQEAVKLGCTSIAFPAISTGVYGYPADEAARIAYRAVTFFLKEEDTLQVYFVFHTDRNKTAFINAIGRQQA